MLHIIHSGDLNIKFRAISKVVLASAILNLFKISQLVADLWEIKALHPDIPICLYRVQVYKSSVSPPEPVSHEGGGG